MFSSTSSQEECPPTSTHKVDPMQKTPKVTHEQVQHVMNVISTRGQKPTIASVRAELGGGSPNTILNFMDDIRGKVSTDTPPDVVLPDFFVVAMKRLLRDARAEAEETALAEVERIRTDMAALQDSARQAEVEFSDLAAELGQSQAEIAALRIELAEAKTAHGIALADAQKSQEQVEKYRSEAEQARLAVAKAEMARDIAQAERDKAHEQAEKNRCEAEQSRLAVVRAEMARGVARK